MKTKIAQKLTLEERSLKFFIIAWVLFTIALAVRFALSIQTYLSYQANPLLQPAPYISKSLVMPFVIICYNQTDYAFLGSLCNTGYLNGEATTCASSLMVSSSASLFCTIFNNDSSVVVSQTNAFMQSNVAIFPLSNQTLPYKAYIISYYENTTDFINSLDQIATVFPVYAGYPVFIGLQLKEQLSLDQQTTTYSYNAVAASSAVYTTAPINITELVNVTAVPIFQVTAVFTTFTVDKTIQTNPMGIFDIISTLGGVFSIVSALSAALFVSTSTPATKRFLLLKVKTNEP